VRSDADCLLSEQMTRGQITAAIEQARRAAEKAVEVRIEAQEMRERLRAVRSQLAAYRSNVVDSSRYVARP
jgi:hypothetical protein